MRKSTPILDNEFSKSMKIDSNILGMKKINSGILDEKYNKLNNINSYPNLNESNMRNSLNEIQQKVINLIFFNSINLLNFKRVFIK